MALFTCRRNTSSCLSLISLESDISRWSSVLLTQLHVHAKLFWSAACCSLEAYQRCLHHCKAWYVVQMMLPRIAVSKRVSHPWTLLLLVSTASCSACCELQHALSSVLYVLCNYSTFSQGIKPLQLLCVSINFLKDKIPVRTQQFPWLGLQWLHAGCCSWEHICTYTEQVSRYHQWSGEASWLVVMHMYIWHVCQNPHASDFDTPDSARCCEKCAFAADTNAMPSNAHSTCSAWMFH